MISLSVVAEKHYEVRIGHDWERQVIELLANRTKVAVIISENFVPDLTALRNLDCELHLFQIPDGEAGKTMVSLSKMWNWFGAIGLTRSDLVIGIGGGAVTDLAGFAAATWLRGVEWVAIPTSLSGMVDAAIGGKTGINSEYGKNLIGAFHSPVLVLIDPIWIMSLPDRDFAAGMAEVIKCGFISDLKILELAKENTIDSLRCDVTTLVELIQRAVAVKAGVVSEDYKESFAREVLNYGHTLGHAIEIHSKYRLRHGEAVSIGLIYAAELAAARGLLTKEEVALHRQLLSAYGLPISYRRDAWQKLLPLLALDKKSRGNKIRFVGLSGVGTTLRLEDLSSDELDSAYERISS